MRRYPFSAFVLTVTALVIGVAANAQGPSVKKLDGIIRQAWQKQGIESSAAVDDARFLRRTYLDIIGTIPSPQVVADFISDRSADKRAQAVDALLGDPRYADHWTLYWDSVLMGKQGFTPVVDRQEFRDWLHGELARNTSWNQLVTKLITATGQNSTGRTYAEANGNMAMKNMGDASANATQTADRSNINGAVNWQLKFAQTPAYLSGVASKVFLGVQIQCAQCHDHKTEKWKQADFKSFTACFTQAVPLPIGGPGMAQKKPMNAVRQVNLTDVNYTPRLTKLNGAEERAPYLQVTPAVLDGTTYSGAPAARRSALASWMTADNNAWFAKAYVNRMWSRFLGRGFVEPIDDFRPSNPAVIPEALEALSEQFKASGYDTRQLIKTICATEAYQLSAAPAPKEDPENQYFSRFRLVPLETDALLNSVVAATNFQTVLAKLPGGDLNQIKTRLQRQLTFVFNTDEEESEQKGFEGTIPQALLLLNGSLTNNGVTPIPGTALAEVMAMQTDAERIESLYLRALSRMPTPDEAAKWTAFVSAPREVAISAAPPAQPLPPRAGPNAAKAGAGKPAPGQASRAGFDPGARMAQRVGSIGETPQRQAYEDMFWALLNSSEFGFKH